jgi:DNA polymerase bacteriophage-type
MTPAAQRALKLRQMLSKSSVSKLDAILDRVSPDGRLRENYKFYGATTGRWSGQGVQLQNLPREAAVWGGQEINLRSAFQAPDGYKFVVADLAAIETRVLAWLTRCQPLLDVFATGRDPYVDFAAFMYGKAPEEVTKHERQIAKSAVLGCGYMLSGGEWKMDCCFLPIAECTCPVNPELPKVKPPKPYKKWRGDEYKSGLWGYAENMGVEMAQGQAHEAVDAYRGRYEAVKDFWYAIEDAAVHCVHSNERKAVYGLLLWTVPGKVLCIELPSGRRLHYLNPQLGPGKYNRPELTHYTYGITTGWIREKLYGGILAENLVQAIARDVLGEGMLRADGDTFPIVGHTHDEIITLVHESKPEGYCLEGLIECMTRPMPWAPDLPLAAEGYESRVYRK